jgi:Glycosyltransferase family 10 (fucosyltransferase) C-term
MTAETGNHRSSYPTLRRLGCLVCIALALAALVRCASLYRQFRTQAASMTSSAGGSVKRSHHGGGAHNASVESTLTSSPPPSAVSSSPPTTAPRIAKSPRHVYTCGYRNLFAMPEPWANLAKALFPDANTSHWDEHAPGAPPSSEDLGPDDVLIWPCGGACPFYPTMEMATRFPGPILTVNGESVPEKCELGPPRDNIFPLDFTGVGTGDPSVDASAKNRSSSIATFVPAIDLASRPRELRRIIFDPVQRAEHANTGERFLIYAVSSCLHHREVAFRALSEIGDVYYGGGCSGGSEPPYETVGLQDEDAQRGSWVDNPVHFHRYRFALVMENAEVGHYVTEKIMNAFFAGTIPVYFGTRDVFELFNPRAFVFYDIYDPQPALDLVAHLEANKTAYQSMLREPILARGDETASRYFSFYDDEPGAGHLKWAIRELLGFGYS